MKADLILVRNIITFLAYIDDANIVQVQPVGSYLMFKFVISHFFSLLEAVCKNTN